MAILGVESFTWPGTVAVLVTRYNVGAGGVTINTSGGRFTGGALQATGGNQQSFNTRSTVSPTFRIGVAMYSDSWGNSGTTNFCLALIDTATVQCGLVVNNVSKLVEFRRGDGTLLATGTTVLNNSSWYYFELLVTISDAAGSGQLLIDGVQQFNVTGVDTKNTATTNITSFRLTGQAANAGSTNRWCDMFWADAGPVSSREWRVSLLSPDGDGAVSGWTPSTGTALWSLVDEVPPNGDADYISTATPGTQALFTLSDLPYDPQVVGAVQVSAYARKDDAGVREIALLLRPTSAITQGTTQAITSSYLDTYLQLWENNPDGGSWTGGLVNGLQAGVVLVT